LIEEIHELLRSHCRKQQGRAESPSLDSQSVKTASMTEEKGYDCCQKITGRKRHIVTDTMGFILSVVVHSADIKAPKKFYRNYASNSRV